MSARIPFADRGDRRLLEQYIVISDGQQDGYVPYHYADGRGGPCQMPCEEWHKLPRPPRKKTALAEQVSDILYHLNRCCKEFEQAGRAAERGDEAMSTSHTNQAEEHRSAVERGLAAIVELRVASVTPKVPAPVGPVLVTPVEKVTLALARFLLAQGESATASSMARSMLQTAVLDAEYGPKPEANVDRPSDRRRQGGIVFCAVAVDATGENLQVMDGTGRLSWVAVADWHKLEPVSAPKPRWEWHDVDGTFVARSGLWELRVVPSTREWQVQFAGNSSWLADPNRPAKDVAEAQLQAEEAALKLAQDAIPERAQKSQTE